MSGHWVINAWVSWGYLLYQDVIMYPAWKWQGRPIWTKSTSGKCHALLNLMPLSDLKHSIFLTLYGMKKAKSMSAAYYQISRQRKTTPVLIKLPPAHANMMLHLMQAHLQIMLWKAADQREPICRDKRQLHLGGRLLKEGLSCPLFPPRQG